MYYTPNNNLTTMGMSKINIILYPLWNFIVPGYLEITRHETQKIHNFLENNLFATCLTFNCTKRTWACLKLILFNNLSDLFERTDQNPNSTSTKTESGFSILCRKCK